MTFPDSAGEGILKVDTMGRVRVPRERREQLLREFAASGISVRRFAQLAGVKPVTFYSWIQKQRTLGSEAPLPNAASPVTLMEAVFGGGSSGTTGTGGALVVHLCGGARAEVTNRQGVPLLAQLLWELFLNQPGLRTDA